MKNGFMLLSVLGALLSLMILTPLLVGWFFRAAHDRVSARRTAEAVLLAGSILEKLKAGRTVSHSQKSDDLEADWNTRSVGVGLDEVKVHVLHDRQELYCLCALMRRRS